jgi:hypothetical protein
MKIVFLNGPPGCGKDTAVSHLVQYLQFTHLKFAAPIKRMACALLGEDAKWLEENKDIPLRTLRLADGAAIANIDTPRQLLIALSEDLLKKRYGNDFFGLVMNREIEKAAQKLILISDSGFLEEARPIINKWGHKNCLQICITRNGHTFYNDSRSYWQHSNVERKYAYNDSTIHDLTMRVLYAMIKTWPTMKESLLKEPQWIK